MSIEEPSEEADTEHDILYGMQHLQRDLERAADKLAMFPELLNALDSTQPCLYGASMADAARLAISELVKKGRALL